MTKTLSGLDRVIRNVYSEEDRELVAKACMKRYKETISEIHKLESQKDICESFVIGFPFGIISTGILIAGLGLFCYLRGDIQCATDLIKAYALISPIYASFSFIFYELMKRIENKISKKESEAVLYELCYEIFKRETKQLKY